MDEKNKRRQKRRFDRQ